VLYSENFNDGNVIGYQGQYEGFGKSDFGPAFWFSNAGKLEGGLSDACQESFVWYTGDANWADVAVTTHLFVNNQGSGVADLLARVQNKNTYYAFRYKHGGDVGFAYETNNGLITPKANPTLQIFKVINGKYTLLAETNAPGIPGVNNGGNYDDKLLGIKFVAKGARLEGYLNIEGQGWVNWLTTNDTELKVGKIGVAEVNNYAMWDDILVETVD
jgi:hypothetical protein